MPREYAGKTDRELVIEWLKEDLAFYKKNVGKFTEFNTLITEELIDTVMIRIRKLEEKERNVNYRRLSKLYN